jgi:SAM-dependent methyltransferase
MPPTPPAKVPFTPEVLEYLQANQAHSVPSSSTPPSLDGSLDSEQMALLSAPPTPSIGYDSEDDSRRPSWGVQLQPSAMATLEAIAGSSSEYLFEQQTEQVIELSNRDIAPAREMQQSLPPLKTNLHRHNSVILTPSSQQSMDSLTKLEIPSPGGFFASLGHNARHTWHLVPMTPENDAPPSSTTAENFYNTPWAPNPIEQIVEVSEPAESEGPPTARRIRPGLNHTSSEETVIEDIVVDEIVTDYATKLEETAEANIDRTCMWLTAQHSFLSELINPTEARDDEVALLKRAATLKIKIKPQSPVSSPKAVGRKTVRFSAALATSSAVTDPVPKIARLDKESTYYRAFQHFLDRSCAQDTFVHRQPRFEALQTQRVTFPAAHRAQLLGKYQLSVLPLSPKRRMSSNVARGDDDNLSISDPSKVQSDKEAEALDQMASATWNVMAAKILNGGRLIAAPIAKRLARLSSMGPKADGTERARILDLGGQATCDWAWHCASEYPSCKVYTVTTKALRQLSNSNIRGPKNLRQVAVDRLTKLPFKDNQFDVVSAREIYSILKERSENGEDEWDLCLKECMRILKPGGYLEFSIMDSDIVNAGPLGLAKSVEFGFNLKTLGYDPSPTKLWLGRLKRSGFVGIKRAWVFLPMGAKTDENKIVNRDSVGVERTLELEAMVSGNTNDAASVSGLVGGWAWEKWLLRCKVQTVGDEGMLEGVQGIVEEGRACGAGWRTVNGWARKPF